MENKNNPSAAFSVSSLYTREPLFATAKTALWNTVHWRKFSFLYSTFFANSYPKNKCALAVKIKTIPQPPFCVSSLYTREPLFATAKTVLCNTVHWRRHSFLYLTFFANSYPHRLHFGRIYRIMTLRRCVT